jgi:hypothetical protein
VNKAKLAANLYARVWLRPIAWRRMTDGTWLAPIDDDWIITEVNERELRIQNIRTDHVPLLGLDHVHHYRERSGARLRRLRHGFLDLNTQLTLSGCNVFAEPLCRHRPHRTQRTSRADAL